MQNGRQQTSTRNAWHPAIFNFQFPILNFQFSDKSIIGMRTTPVLGSKGRTTHFVNLIRQ